ncbi:phosphatidylethanolamine-binding protein [Pholiota molesta]|nr:phosphatidylethanolamine-binding protein [Pholiota molesta]
MLALRRVPRALPRSLVLCPKANSTLAAAPSVAESVTSQPDASAPATPTTNGRRRRKQPPKRPTISLTTPRKWNRPLGEGVVPAYDLALQELKRDSLKLKEEAAELRKVVEAKEAEYQTLKAKLQTSKIPEAQELFSRKSDMSNTSHRYLVEQKWRKDGDLDLLMERLYQMSVVPDVLPVIKPSLDLHLIVRTRPTEFIEEKKIQTHVEPGSFVKPKQTEVPPKLRVNVFHTDTRLYTMLLSIPVTRSGSREPEIYNFLHWMKPNIPLSATSSHISDLNTHTKYIPPHPQQGTPYHRYVVLLLPQPPLGASDYTLAAASRALPGSHLRTAEYTVVPTEERHGFDVRQFAQRWNLDASKGGGAHMFREIWDEEVSAIYKSVLGKEEPRYGRPPRIDTYAHLKGKKKYIL